MKSPRTVAGSSVASVAQHEVGASGYCFLADEVTEQDFRIACASIGQIQLITPVKIQGPHAPTLFSNKKMEPHTDTPAAKWVAWYCVREGLDGESTLLIDGRKVLNDISPSSLAELAGIRCSVPSRSQVPTPLHLQYERHAILRPRKNGHWLNYTPYLKCHAKTSQQRTAMAELRAAIRHAGENPITVHLRRGQGLIIENGRYLHWRTNLRADSPRCHYRYLIS